MAETSKESANTLDWIKHLMDSLADSQKKVAAAHERRARAEERKADALEKRVEAQQRMANALGDLADAIRNNGGVMWSSRPMADETDALQPRSSSLEAAPDGAAEEIAAPQPDDLFDLLSTPDASPSAESADIEEASSASTFLDSPVPDDLDALLDMPEPETTSEDAIELGLDEEADEIGIDDLLEMPEETGPEPEDAHAAPAEEETADTGIEAETGAPPPDGSSDGAGDTAPEKPPADYKSKIIALLIQMKVKQGLNVEQATASLNENGHPPLSGKDTWDTATVAKIYEHIDLVRQNKGGTL